MPRRLCCAAVLPNATSCGWISLVAKLDRKTVVFCEPHRRLADHKQRYHTYAIMADKAASTAGVNVQVLLRCRYDWWSPQSNIGPVDKRESGRDGQFRCAYNVPIHHRPATQAEVSNKVPQVIRCNEAAREVTLYQHVGGKALGRTFHFDKV